MSQTLLRRTLRAYGLILVAESLAGQLMQPRFQPNSEFSITSWTIVQGFALEIANQVGTGVTTCGVDAPVFWSVNSSGQLEREGPRLRLNQLEPISYDDGNPVRSVLDRSYWDDPQMSKTKLMPPLHELPLLFDPSLTA